eukprot:529244_1
MQPEYPQSNFYYSCILISFIIWIIVLLLDVFWYQPDKGIFTWIWDLWASGILIQWIVYIFRMLEIRKQFRQSKKDGVLIISDKTNQANVFFQYVFCIPWWATKIDNVAIDLIGKEYRKYIQKRKDDNPIDMENNHLTATL